MTDAPSLLAVVGATGTGKSEFALDIVDVLRARGDDAVIIGADAMQLYRGMDIGTAKLPVADRRGIEHHMIDVLDPDEDAAVAWYQSRARSAIDSALAEGRSAVLVGGSGLYVSSVLFDFRFPPRDAAMRAQLEADLDALGPGVLFERLQALDPATADRVDARNGRRVVRALEVAQQGASGHGAVLPEKPRPWREHSIFALDVARADLVERVDARVVRMWADGLVDEVSTLVTRGLESGTTAGRAIGYAQALAQLRGTMDEATAISETQALTRRYARRQVSWFRRYRAARWVDPARVRPADLI